MVDVSEKNSSRRVAVSEGCIKVGKEILHQIEAQTNPKGDVLTVARVAGIMGAKQTDKLIPLCHQITLECVQIDMKICRSTESIIVRAQVECHHKTGVEMESLMAVSITLLTLYDMCKSLNKSIIISNIKLLSKTK